MFKLQTFLSIIMKFKKKKFWILKHFKMCIFGSRTMNNRMKHMTSTKCTQYYKDITAKTE